MNVIKWVLIDNTQGATTQDGSALSAASLARMAEAVADQVNNEVAAEWGARVAIRVGAGSNDIQPGEWAYSFLPSLPDAPGASAYHDVNGKGVPFSLCAITTCHSLYGQNGVSVDVSHEILETAGDRGANSYAYDGQGTLHAFELCDAVEVQAYPKQSSDGTVVLVSNWLLQSWFIPHSPGPYDYMTSAGLPGAVAPSGPMRTARGHGGNYQIVSAWGGASKTFAARHVIEGVRRKGPYPHWSSRAGRRIAQMPGVA